MINIIVILENNIIKSLILKFEIWHPASFTNASDKDFTFVKGTTVALLTIALGRHRNVDLFEFQASLLYMVVPVQPGCHSLKTIIFSKHLMELLSFMIIKFIYFLAVKLGFFH